MNSPLNTGSGVTDAAWPGKECEEADARGVLSCPYCGKEAGVGTAGLRKGTWHYQVLCDTTDCRGNGNEDTQISAEQARLAWNRRAPPIPTDGRDAGLREAAKVAHGIHLAYADERDKCPHGTVARERMQARTETAAEVWRAINAKLPPELNNGLIGDQP